MSSEQFITKDKKKELEKELDNLVNVVRPEVISRVQAARELGDLKENSEYHSARDDQARINSRIEEIEYILKNAKIFEAGDQDEIQLGSTAIVEDISSEEEKEFELVGEEEADFGAGKISNTSPIGEALIGKKVGDSVEITTPGGTIEYKVKEIQ